MGRQKSSTSTRVLGRMLEINSYDTVWTIWHKVRKAMADRDATHKLAGLIEMDDPYFGTSKPGMRCRRAVVKAKLVVPLMLVRSLFVIFGDKQTREKYYFSK
jgi:hypothetical protein